MTIYVMLSGLPGNMATEATRVLEKQDDIEVSVYALTGPREKDLMFHGRELIPPSRHLEYLRDRKDSLGDDLIVVDYSKALIQEHAELYARAGVPFVYGGTIGNRAEAEWIVRESDISAVIAPNMSRQLVAWTAALEYIAREFPNAFSGYTGHINEDHQLTKTDPSGTGLAWMRTMREWGIEFDEMHSIRDKEFGHAYHDVDLESPDGTVRIGFYTRVDGRQTYADGTPDAVRYLHRKMQEGSQGEVFSMVDVLRKT